MSNPSSDDLTQQITMARKAYMTLDRAFGIYTGDDLHRDGIIQRFEYCVEILWKTLKIYMQYQSIETPIVSPKAVFRLAHTNNILTDVDICMDFVDCRNMLSHLYSEPESDDIFDFIRQHYTYIDVILHALDTNHPLG